MFPLLSLLLLSYIASAKSSQLINPSSTKFHDKNIFILAGQSNMAGRGGVINDTWDRIVPPESQPNASILRFNAKLEWEEALEPLHADIDINKTCGIGPGMEFANAVRSRIGVVGLVPCAIGGTNISEWSRGTWLYNQLVNRAKASMRKGGMIQAILWYQGESDTLNREDAESYKANLEKLFWALRADLQSPLLPIIQVALASGQGPFMDVVRNAQLQLDLTKVRCVDAKGLPLEPDALHLTTPAQVRLGQMLAKAFLKEVKTRIALVTNAASTTAHHPWAYLFMCRMLWVFLVLGLC